MKEFRDREGEKEKEIFLLVHSSNDLFLNFTEKELQIPCPEGNEEGGGEEEREGTEVSICGHSLSRNRWSIPTLL